MDSLENDLFQRIKALRPSSWREEVSQLLGISVSSLYKKARGQTALTFRECQILSKQFSISLDEVCGLGSGITPFTTPTIDTPHTSIHGYLMSLASELGGISTSSQEVQVLYATSEIPVFHYMHSPYLGAFKIAAWAKSVWKLHTKTSLQDIIEELINDQQYMALCKGILSGYCSIPSVELWPLTLMDNTLNQIRYYKYSRELANLEIVNHLVDSLYLLVDHYEEMASTGTKKPMIDGLSGSSKLDLYYNEIFHTNNTIILDRPNLPIVFLTHDSPNFIKSQDLRFINYTKNWFYHVCKMSTKISLENQRQRKFFANELRSRIDVLAKEVR